MSDSKPIKSESGTEFMARLKKMQEQGIQFQIVSNPVNPDGSLTPAAQAALDASNTPERRKMIERKEQT